MRKLYKEIQCLLCIEFIMNIVLFWTILFRSRNEGFNQSGFELGTFTLEGYLLPQRYSHLPTKI